MIEKTCTKCLLTKSIDDFRTAKGYRDGRHSQCKACEYENLKNWRANNPDKLKAQGDRWRANNPEKKRASNLQRHNIRRSLTEDDLVYIAAITNDPCAYCGAPMEHVDHIDPVSLGGTSDWTNFTPACGSCNHGKAAKPLLLWMATR